MNTAADGPHATLTRAWVLLRLGLRDEAARLVIRLAALTPGRREDAVDARPLLVGAVDILHAAGHGAAARRLIRDRLRQRATGAGLAGDWGVWLLVHRLDDPLALQCLERAAVAEPDSAALLGWLTQALARLGDAGAAWPRWQALFGRLADDAAAREHGARVWAWLHRRDLAALCLQGLSTPTDGATDADARARRARVQHLWRVLRDEAPAPRPDADLLRHAFDRSAAGYDRQLQSLDNRGPALLQQVLDRLGIGPGAALTVLDAGCGTGLCADVLRPLAARLMGLDLSPAMLAQAHARRLYDRLTAADLCDAAPADAPPADLIVCWDVLVYFGDLRPPLAALAARLAPGGRLLVLVEAADTGIVGGIGGRQAHGIDHLLQALAEAGLQPQWLCTAPQLRLEFGSPVACHLATGVR